MENTGTIKEAVVSPISMERYKIRVDPYLSAIILD